MKKRVWKALLCCVLAMAMLPAAAFAAPEADITITDCGAWGEAHPGWFNVGWKYSDGFATDDITAIRVGMKDKWSILPMPSRLPTRRTMAIWSVEI